MSDTAVKRDRSGRKRSITLHVNEDQLEEFERIKDQLGIDSDAGVIRYALEALAEVLEAPKGISYTGSHE